MAPTDDGGKQTAGWPLPKFFFQVKVDGAELAFQEVSGLDLESQMPEYRHGNSPIFAPIKMPGLPGSGNIILKKGDFAKDNFVFDWFTEIRMNTINRKSMTISLMDETGAPTMVWKVANAFPVKIEGTDLTAEGNEVAVESIEIAHEGITFENG